jgi:hypothetical protein
MFHEGYHPLASNVKKGLPNDQVESLKVRGKGCLVTMWQHGNKGGWAAKFKEGEYNCAAIKKAGGACNDMSDFNVAWTNSNTGNVTI